MNTDTIASPFPTNIAFFEDTLDCNHNPKKPTRTHADAADPPETMYDSDYDNVDKDGKEIPAKIKENVVFISPFPPSIKCEIKNETNVIKPPNEGETSSLLENKENVKKSSSVFEMSKEVSNGLIKAEKIEGYDEGQSYFPEEGLIDALTSLFLSLFYLTWSIGIAYWYFVDEEYLMEYFTLAITILGGTITTLSYFLNRNIEKMMICRESGCFLLVLSSIPCLTSLTLSCSNLYYSIRELINPGYDRPWKKTKMVFLVESLTLAFPQGILQLLYLIDKDRASPLNKGLVLTGGIIIITIGIAFARIRYDCAKKRDRFGMGADKVIKGVIVWAHKVLWIVTYTSLILALRKLIVNLWISTIVSISILICIYEAPVILASIKGCMRITGHFSDIFFLLPQFISLASLILWINVDANVYDTIVGVSILGIYFWLELIVICGWILDSTQGRDIEFISMYPHFFGNILAHCCK